MITEAVSVQSLPSMTGMLRVVTLLSLLSLVLVPADGQNTTGIVCDVNIAAGSPTMSQVTVRVDQVYESLTNGMPYGPIVTHVADLTMLAGGDQKTLQVTDRSVDKNTQTLTVGFNGEKVCAAIFHLNEAEACADPGCTGPDPGRTCEHVCFQAESYGTRNRLDFYTSFRYSSGIGNWRTNNYVNVYTVEDVRYQCFSQREKYIEGLGDPEDVPVTTCPVGQRCRLTSTLYTRESVPTYYIGCEDNPSHYDGCEGGCKFNTRETIPGNPGQSLTWATMCRYCCHGDKCNDVANCNGATCRLTDTPVNGSGDDDTTDKPGDGDGDDGQTDNANQTRCSMLMIIISLVLYCMAY